MTRTKGLARQVGAVALTIAGLIVLWEGYKWIGTALDGQWPGTDTDLPIAPNNLTMPHTIDIWNALWDPVQLRSTETLAVFLLKAAWFTLKEAALGFVFGTIIGLGLAVLMLRFKVAERGILPWVNVSQTIPLIALAPIVVTWGRTNGWGDLFSVALISTYLTFFPVAVNGLRGLQSPAPADIELMRSYAARWSKTLFKVRFPSARPYLFPAFKLAATLSVVGAIVGEISAGVRGGLGRVILDFAGRYSTGPPKVYAAVLGAGLLGLFVFALVNLAERYFVRGPKDGVTP
ncbi:MAG: NitT/TauT family transport system permease protein [Verrucomicrobiales bacterium]